LERIPSLIEKYERENEKISKDLPVLRDVVSSVWRRENELKDLKTELAALDRKIQLSLKPVDTGEDNKEEKQQEKPLNPNVERLQEFKQAMGDRLTVASVPNFHRETQPKGIKL
jgi:hypothetical protein